MALSLVFLCARILFTGFGGFRLSGGALVCLGFCIADLG